MPIIEHRATAGMKRGNEAKTEAMLPDIPAMPRTRAEIEALLDQLAVRCGDELEDQELDFKEWDWHSMRRSVRTVVDMAVCMANGGGGTVVFGVADEAVGRERAIVGVPPEVDTRRLRLAVYDSTDPRLTPVFEELRVPEGTGRLILMHVQPGIPPYTDTSGRGTIRIGSNCKPLTGTMRARLDGRAREDFTAKSVEGPVGRLLSPAAMESLRRAASRERAPAELLRLGDEDLMRAIGTIRDGAATRALVLLAGSPSTIREFVPNHSWTHIRMSSPTEYSHRADGNEAVSVALDRMVERVMVDNPIETVRRGLYHFEHSTYPEIAMREAFLNALCHCDYRIPGPRLIRQYDDRIEIASPGGLVGGLTPDNILHHAPVSRNRVLVDALAKLRLINRSSLGMERMYSALLMEGKPPPRITDVGDSVTVTFKAATVSAAFRGFVASEAERGVVLMADHMLILRHLLPNLEIRAPEAARLCHRPERDAVAVLATMEEDFGHLLRRSRAGRKSWQLEPTVREAITDPAPRRVTARERGAAKAAVLRALKLRSGDPEPLANSEVRRLTGLDRNQAWRLMRDLRAEFPSIVMRGRGRAAGYSWVDER